MSTVENSDAAVARRRRQATTAVRDAVRELRGQLSVLNHHVAERIDVKDVDLDCFDLLARRGPMSPSGLAGQAGLHPATMTGVLDRLERAGWIARERDPSDRRAVVIRPLRDRVAELFGLYSGIIGSMNELCAEYSEPELELLAGFLHRAAEAGRRAASELAGGHA